MSPLIAVDAWSWLRALEADRRELEAAACRPRRSRAPRRPAPAVAVRVCTTPVGC